MRIVAALLAVLLPAGSMPAFASAAEGKAVYDRKCKTCHGADGKANPAIAKSLKVEMRALGSKEVQAMSDEKLKEVSLKGTGKMKPVSGISDAEAKDLIAHLRTLK